MIKSISDAKNKIKADALNRALQYLEREIPNTVAAIEFMAHNGATEDEIIAAITEAYGPTEERVIHKLKIVIKNLIEGGE